MHVALTGRTRLTKHRGQRQSLTSREYKCQDCGHVGWSKHIDLERKAEKEPCS